MNDNTLVGCRAPFLSRLKDLRIAIESESSRHSDRMHTLDLASGGGTMAAHWLPFFDPLDRHDNAAEDVGLLIPLQLH